MNAKRLLALTSTVFLGLWLAAPVAAGSAIPAAEGPLPTSSPADGARCDDRSAEQIVAQFLDGANAVGGIPDCPAQTSNCNNGNNLACGEGARCRLTGELDSVDTGLGKCRLAGGGLLNCQGGETVHVTTGDCSKCPCCFAAPPNQCLCPSSCPQFVRVTCGAFGGVGSE